MARPKVNPRNEIIGIATKRISAAVNEAESDLQLTDWEIINILAHGIASRSMYKIREERGEQES